MNYDDIPNITLAAKALAAKNKIHLCPYEEELARRMDNLLEQYNDGLICASEFVMKIISE